MLSTLTLKFGRGAGHAPLSFDPSPMTVLVGPNNAGKTLLLRELEEAIEKQHNNNPRILEELRPRVFTSAQVRRLLLSKKTSLEPERPGEIHVYRSTQDQFGARHILDEAMQKLAGPEKDREVLRDIVRLFTARLDGQTRLKLTDDASMGDLLGLPASHLDALFRNDEARRLLRQHVLAAFGRFLILDPLQPSKLRIRLSDVEPKPEQERSLSDEAVTFNAAARPLSEFSDGVKAYVGVLAAVLSGDVKVILLDEPEAFLHPPLVRRLGSTLAQFVADREGCLIAATHSADFLMGAVASGCKVNLVRLTHEPSTASLLNAEMIRTMMVDPLLRSTKLLSALFYAGAVVCEGDVDRAFYGEINARLLASNSGGADNTLFLTSYSWQSEQRIVAPLRAMGIPAVAIVDLDVVRKTELKELLKACAMPAPLIEGAGQARGQIAAIFKEAGADPKAGIDVLPSTVDRETCRAFLRQLAVYGLFIVPVGEVERWVAPLNVIASKQSWLPAVFERLGSDVNSASYVRPSADDVWEFGRAVARWLADPNRSGMAV